MLLSRLVSVGLLLTFTPLATGLGGCGGSTGQNAASQALKTPELPTDKQAKCRVAKSQAEPLIVEWPDAARGKLESVSRRSLVAVRYEGCELAVLGRCTVKNAGSSSTGSYNYSPITRKQSKVTIKDADELYASMPVGAVKLEGKLQSAGQLNVQMTIVGRYESPTHTVYREDLDGDCSEATHIVAALTVGSFTFSAGADAEVGGGVSVAGVAGTGAKSTATRETIQHDGDEAACSKAGTSDKAPPEGCGALIQIEVMPLTKGVRPAVAAVVVPVPTPTPTPAPKLADPSPLPSALPPSASTKPIKCKRNEHAEDGVCVKGPAPKIAAAKPPPTKPSVASATPTCAPGQHLYNTRCVDDEPPVPSEPPPSQPSKPEWTPPPTCLAGTHLENGACVIDSEPPPDRAVHAYGSGEQPATGEQPNPWRLTLLYVAIGAGITSASTGLIALGTAGKAKEECSNGACSEKYADLQKTATTTAIIADVALGITVLSIVGIFLLPSKVKVGVVPTPNGVVASTGWRF